MLDRLRSPAQHRNRLVADLVSIAVGAVEEVSSPALAYTWDVGKLVPQSGGDQNTAGAHRAALGQRDAKAHSGVWDDSGDAAIHHQAAIALHLLAAHSEKVGR